MSNETENTNSSNSENENENSSNEDTSKDGSGDDNTSNDNTTDSDVDYEAKAKELEEKNKNLYARAKKAEEEAKQLKNKPPQPKEVGETNQEYEDRLKSLELGTIGDKSETVLKAIEEHKKVYPDKSYKEISEMPFIKSIEEAETEQKKLDNASISPDGKQTEQPNQSFKGMTIKEFNDKHNPEGGEMTDAISDLYEKLKKDNA